MTLAAEQAKAAKDLDTILEIELCHRIDIHTWTQCGAPNTAVFWMDHAENETEAVVLRVEECNRSSHAITIYDGPSDGITSIAACQAQAGSWYYDAATGRLYVHTTGGNSPSTAGAYYLASYFLEGLCNGQREGSQALYFNGLWYPPYLDESSIPEAALEVSMFGEGGVKQSFGGLSLINTDGYFDTRIADPKLTSLTGYNYMGQRAWLKVGAPGDAYGALKTIWKGRTGGLSWTDERLELDTEDERMAVD